MCNKNKIMNRKTELILIIKALKFELYDALLEINNEKDTGSLKGIERAKELLTNYENSKNEFNKL